MLSDNVTLEDFRIAVDLFSLPGRFTIDRLKGRYRQLSRKHHPDFGGCAQQMAEVNRAYEILLSYVDHYHYQMDEDEFLRQNPSLKYYYQFHQPPPSR
ncbi:hypothetical protein [Desulfurispira natronophila]|uniref:J domain-containing protein n=1 Tax=Desulfurispira natronophila TaxID=682562 RepID=A0A7W7Y5Z5_9BACT|nr:hypothetical protein [Desulfurispira natronophila]MBB5022723.1 hypothetical protein [Desulfurispira natronophila]